MTTSLQLREEVTKKIEEKFSIFFEDLDVNMRVLEANSEKGFATALFEDNNTKDKVLLEWAILKSGFTTRMIVGADNALGKAMQEAFTKKLKEAKEACYEVRDLIDQIPDYKNNESIPQTQFATNDLEEDENEEDEEMTEKKKRKKEDDDEEMTEKKKKKMKEAKKKKEEDDDDDDDFEEDDNDDDNDDDEVEEKKKKKEARKKKEAKKKKEDDDDLEKDEKDDLKEALSELSIQNRMLQKQVEHLQEASLKMAAELKQSRAASLNEILNK